MTTKIEVWQINDDDELVPIETSMSESGRDESHDLQNWIRDYPELLGDDLLIIGEQVKTMSGYIDFLAVDSLGDTVIIELKRDIIPRKALAQAIDYASDVAYWDYDYLNDICKAYYDDDKLELADFFAEEFELGETETDFFNQEQRILLVGFSIKEPLQRMIEWLSTKNVRINAILFRCIKTQNGEELIAKTTIISE